MTSVRVSLRDRMLASTDFMGKMATSMSFIVNTALRMPLTKSVMDFTLGIDHHRNFPYLLFRTFESWMRRKALTSRVFHAGCHISTAVVNYNNPALGRDLVRLMNAIGYGVSLLEKGALLRSGQVANKMVDEARRDARLNIGSIRKAVSQGQPVA